MDRIEPSAGPADLGPEPTDTDVTCSGCGRPMFVVVCDACHGNGWVLELRREYVKTPLLRFPRYETRIIQRDCSLCSGNGERSAV